MRSEAVRGGQAEPPRITKVDVAEVDRTDEVSLVEDVLDLDLELP
jgi:hypothetical protein